VIWLGWLVCVLLLVKIDCLTEIVDVYSTGYVLQSIPQEDREADASSHAALRGGHLFSNG
jgi:hypothetical protein